MKPGLRVSFNSPQSGYMSIGLKTDHESFVTAVSHSPYDSLRDLITGLSAMLNGEESVTIKWNCEPEEYDFDLRRNGENAEFKIIRYPSHHRVEKQGETVFSHNASAVNICTSFRVALHELYSDRDVDEFDKNWRRKFPEKEMRELTMRIREITASTLR